MSTALTDALALLMRIASGEPGAYGEPPTGDEDMTALVVGLNMLAEELDHERAKRMAAERLLADERDAYDRSPAFMCSIDAQSLLVLRANETLATALGVPRSSLIGRPVISLFVERDRVIAERVIRAAIDDSRDAFPELALACDGGLRVTSNASLTDDGTRLRLVWRDVSRERQLEAHLQQAQKMQAVGRLAGGIAHDFNNILAIILASASFVRPSLPAGSPAHDDLTVIEQAAQRGAGLTSQLLSFSRQQIVRPQLVEIGALVREVDRMLRRLISESIEISLIVADEDLVTRIDPAQLTQVLVNLVVNARDAVNNKGRVIVEVSRVDLDDAYCDQHLDVSPGAYVALSVSDDGEGMPPEVLAQIFEPFFTTKPVGEGSGLGLSVCYGVVRQVGGHIWAYSEPGVGTTIKVYLPLETGAVKRPAPADRARGSRGAETILLVEDDGALRSLTTRLLERAGYRVVAVTNGVEAVEYVASTQGVVDLLVTDVVMPGMGGRELADKLVGERRTRGVLYISGYTANSIVHHGALESHVAFLAKPFTSDQLLRAVRTSLDRPEE